MLLINMFSNPKERRVVECRKFGMSHKQISKVMISVRDNKSILNRVGNVSEYADNDGIAGPDSLMSIYTLVELRSRC